MPTANPPNYKNIQQQTIECLLALKNDATEELKALALNKLESIWRGVDWTHIPQINQACAQAAREAIESAATESPKPLSEDEPKNVVTESTKVKETDLDDAYVDQHVVIE